MSIMPRMGRCFSCGYDHGNGFGDERLLNALARITELESAIEARSLPANERVRDEAYERAAKVCEAQYDFGDGDRDMKGVRQRHGFVLRDCAAAIRALIEGK